MIWMSDPSTAVNDASRVPGAVDQKQRIGIPVRAISGTLTPTRGRTLTLIWTTALDVGPIPVPVIPAVAAVPETSIAAAGTDTARRMETRLAMVDRAPRT